MMLHGKNLKKQSENENETLSNIHLSDIWIVGDDIWFIGTTKRVTPRQT